MSRTIEADFLPSPVEEAKEKPRILIIDDNRKVIDSGKLAPVIDRILLLSEARRAHELESNRSHSRKNCPARGGSNVMKERTQP